MINLTRRRAAVGNLGPATLFKHSIMSPRVSDCNTKWARIIWCEIDAEYQYIFYNHYIMIQFIFRSYFCFYKYNFSYYIASI